MTERELIKIVEESLQIRFNEGRPVRWITEETKDDDELHYTVAFGDE
jgi:hypothetical protein